MPINVVCKSCKQRFTVSDQFAGQTGPCPNCKTPIKIPDAGEEVQIHAPKDMGPADSEGKPVLKPIERKEEKISALVWIIVAGVTVLSIVMAFVFRGSEDPTWVLVAGAILLGPPISAAAYSVLREEELEPFSGGELWLRSTICGLVYAIFWALYVYFPGWLGLEQLEFWEMGIFIPVLVAGGSVAPLAALELEYTMSVVHYAFYIVVCVILCMIMDVQLM